MKKYTAILLTALAFFSHLTMAQSNCEKAFDTLTTTYPDATYADLHQHWKNEKALCGESDFFELKLGGFEIILGQLDQAEKTFKAGLAKKGSFVPELELAIAEIPFQKSSAGRQTADKTLLAKAEKMTMAFVEKYPHRADGYAQLTGIMLIKGEFEKVIEYAELSQQYGKEAFAFRNAVIAHYQLENDTAIIEAAKEALRLHGDFTADIDFMLSTALAYSNTENYQMALKIFTLLHQSNKNAQATPKFQNALQFVRQKYIESESRKSGQN